MATLEKRIESLERVQPGVWAVEWMFSHGAPTPEQTRIAEERRAQGIFVIEVTFVSARPFGDAGEDVRERRRNEKTFSGDPRQRL